MRFRRARRVAGADALGFADPLADADYEGAFAVYVIGDARTPEQWARNIFEDAPPLMRSFVLVGWRLILRLRLAPRPSPDHILGWKIVRRSADSIILEVESAALTARKALLVDGGRVTVITFIRYERWWARALWSAVAPVHHRTEPYLLGHAASYPYSLHPPNASRRRVSRVR